MIIRTKGLFSPLKEPFKGNLGFDKVRQWGSEKSAKLYFSWAPSGFACRETLWVAGILGFLGIWGSWAFGFPGISGTRFFE